MIKGKRKKEKGKTIVGVDIGGTYTKIGLVSTEGAVLHKKTLLTKKYRAKDALISAIAEAVEDMLIKHRLLKRDILGIGIGAPGRINSQRGIVRDLTNIKGWKDVPLAAILQARLGIRTFVDNDANVFTLAEFMYGSGRGSRNMIGVTLGTGVGGGIIIEGRLYRGSSFSAGEIGHVAVNEQGPKCQCPSRGCIETYVGNSYLKARALGRSPQELDRAAKRGERSAIRVWKETGFHLGVLLAGMVNLLNPDRIVIGGGIAKAGKPLFEAIRKTVNERAMAVPRKAVRIVKAKFTEDAGIIGAAALVMEKLIQNPYRPLGSICAHIDPRGLYGRCVAAVLAMTFTFIPHAFAQEPAAKIPIICTGDNVEYSEAEKKITAQGNVVVTYQAATLTCDKVTVFPDTKEAVAEGNVTLKQGGSELAARRMEYNFVTQKGKLLGIRAHSGPYYVGGEQAEKISGKEVVVRRGYVTTCDKDPPHYKISCKKVVIFLDDKIVAKNVLVKAGEVPVMYVPSYTHSLKGNRPKVTVIPGRSSDWGWYTLTAWRYDMDQAGKGNVHLDYREKRNFGTGLDYYYKEGLLGNSALRTYYSPQGDTEQRGRYRTQARNRWDISQKDLFVGELNKESDRSMLKDYFEKEYERENAPLTYATLLHSEDRFTAELLAQKRMNHFETTVERIPQLKLDAREQPIGDTMFFYKGADSVALLNKEHADTEQDESAFRADSYNQVSVPRRFFDWLSVSPFAGVRQTYYSRENNEHQDVVRGAFYTGLDSSTKFYNTYSTYTDALNLDINELHHIVTPRLSYDYIHRPTVGSGRLTPFDAIDTIERTSRFTPALENRLQTKRMDKESGNMRSVDLASVVIETPYMLRGDAQRQGFGDTEGRLELRPYSWLAMDAETIFETRAEEFKTLGFDIYAGETEDYRLGLGHRYERDTSSESIAEWIYRINSLWKFRAYERYEFQTKELERQEYTIYRDLHCWLAELTYSIDESSGHSIWIIFKLKAFPEIPIQFGSTYNPKRTLEQAEH